MLVQNAIFDLYFRLKKLLTNCMYSEYQKTVKVTNAAAKVTDIVMLVAQSTLLMSCVVFWNESCS